MSITVIIPTYNRSELLWKTLDGLRRQSKVALINQVIVISDGSTDDTKEVTKSFSSGLPIQLFEQSRLGVSRARNLGIRETKSEVLLFLDDDVIPESDLIAEHVRFHQEMPCLKAALMGYVTWYPEVKITPFMRWYGEYGGLFGFSLLKENQEADPRYLYTCNVSFKTEFIRGNNGFTESLSVLEDHELAYRLAKQGLRLYFRRAALGYHNQTFTFEQACERLERYSAGLNAFLCTEAGRSMARKKNRRVVRVIEAAAIIGAKSMSPMKPLMDSKVRLPNWLYRLFYWYYGTHLSFWEHALPSLLGGRD